MLLGNPLSLGALVATSVVSYAASEGASFGAKKLLNKTGLTDNQKMVADLAVRILAGAAVSGAASKVAGSIAEKKAAEVAAKKAAEEAELAKKAAEAATKKVAKEAEEAAKLATKKRVPKFPDGITKEVVESTEDYKWEIYSFDVDGVRTELYIETHHADNLMTFIFDVGGTMNKNDALDARIKKKIALKLKKTFDYLVHNSEDGKILRCSAYAGDGQEAYRESAYKAFGFSEAQGKSKYQLAQVKDGKPYAFYPPNIESWLSSLKAV